jgi:CheY-like chemotaxis protein
VIDPAKLKQVLYNYLSNAIKFTPERGRITIRALPEASDFTAASESKFAAVVLDLLMPELDGFKFLDRFREIFACRNTPVIIWTNKDITAEDRDRLKHSAQSIALKGRDGIDSVLRELERHVAGGDDRSSGPRELKPGASVH